MKSLWFVLGAVAIASLPVRSSALLAQQPAQQGQPGMPTLARVQVVNRSGDEAIPIVVKAGGDVQPVAVISAPAVTLAPNTVVDTRAIRQSWDYRHLFVKSGQDVAVVLNQAGGEGWEAVGVAPGAAGLQVVLKRPR
jgi:hypothetical protein